MLQKVRVCVINIDVDNNNKEQAMIKIKSDLNPKLLKNFSNESFPDINVLTATSKYPLTLAYLVIDSEYFNSLAVDAP